MENKTLYTKELNKKITEVLVRREEDIKIAYDGGYLLIGTEHSQDCCENVYADFSPMDYLVDKLKDKKISNITIKGVEDMGFLLCFEEKYNSTHKVFIPCYNSQNGYYSDNLELVIHDNEQTVKIDISNLVEDILS